MTENNISTIKLKRLLISHNLLVAGRFFFEIFLSVFIWKQTGSLSLVAWFNIVYLMLHTIAFTGFAGLVKKGKVHLIRKSALIGYTFVYFMTFLLGENAINHVLLIAFGIGVFNGMYWISYQTLRFDLTHSRNRGNYTGIENSGKLAIGIIMPPLGGAIVVADYFGLGYSNIFLLGAFLFLLSYFIGNVNLPVHETSGFHFWDTFRVIRKNKDIMKSMYAYIFSSFSRGGTIARLLIPLLIFDVLKNEFHMGGWLSFFSVVAIFSSLTFGKLIDYKHYKGFILAGGIIYFLLILSLICFPSFTVYIVFGALIKVIEIFIAIPKRVISENLIHSIADFKNHRVEYIAIREWFNIAFGRVSSFIVLLTAGGLIMSQMSVALFFMALGILAEIFLLRSIKTNI
ncbi:MFS transporter [Candidatus Woesearchaeota archaeon]|nr:MFS transporter [Candidatus Woesearchaeota archaeon]